MPTLFDSHEEFNEWFSKDIENHAENKSAIDQGISVNTVFVLPWNRILITDIQSESTRKGEGEGGYSGIIMTGRGERLLLGLEIFCDDLVWSKDIGNSSIFGLD